MKIGYVNVFVRDLKRAVTFYESTLGLKLDHAEMEHGYASFSAGPVHLGLAVAGETQQDLVGRHTGVGFVVDDLAAEYKRLNDLGVVFEMPPTRQPWGGFLALAADVDGNIFYLDEVSAVHH